MLIWTRLCLAYSPTASSSGWQSRSEQLRLAGAFPKQNLLLVINKRKSKCSYQELTQGLSTGEYEDRQHTSYLLVLLRPQKYSINFYVRTGSIFVSSSTSGKVLNQLLRTNRQHICKFFYVRKSTHSWASSWWIREQREG